MIKKIINIIIFIYSLFNLIYIFLNTDKWQMTSIYTIELWLYKVVLSIVPIYLLTSLLLVIKPINHFIYQIIKKYKLFENEKAFSLFIISYLTGNPTSCILIKKALNNNEISYEQANKLFRCCSHVSFLFVIMIFNNYIGIILIISQILTTLFLYLFKTKFHEYSFFDNSINILDTVNNIIEDLPMILLKILISMLIISIIRLPLDNLNNNGISFFLNFFEVTIGINNIIKSDNNIFYIILFSSILLSANGLCILLQIYNVIKKTKLNIRSFLVTRIYHIIISSIISLVLLFLFMNFCF